MPKALTKEEKIIRFNEYNKCCNMKEREELAKKYGYKNRISLRSVIYTIKKEMGVKIEIISIKQEANSLSDDEKLDLINKWGLCSREEKEELVKKYNTTYTKLRGAISRFRKKFNIKYNRREYLTDEEKIKRLEEFNKAKNIVERKKLAEKYGVNYDTFVSVMTLYRVKFNINEYVDKHNTDGTKLNIVKDWDNTNNDIEREAVVKKYNYKNIQAARVSINRFRRQLIKKGLI